MSSAPDLHYVLGITGRSGMNFLANLVWAHRDCSNVDQLYEDYFLAEPHRLTGFASDPTASPAVAKTPSIKNLELLNVMPIGKSVVIVRDGRAVVESGMRSFAARPTIYG